MPQHMRPLTPEARHRLPNRRILPLRMRIHVARVRELRDRGGSDEVDLTMREGLQGREREAFGEGVDFRVLEELNA